MQINLIMNWSVISNASSKDTATTAASHRISLVTIKGYCPKALLCCSARKQQQQPLLLFKLLLGGFWKGIEQDGEEMFVMVYVVKQQSYSFPPFL